MFGVTHMSYFEYMVGNSKFRADYDKDSIVIIRIVPESVEYMQLLVGFSNYYNRYIPKFASILLLLIDLWQMHIAYYWEDEQLHAFDIIKVTLTGTHVLALPDPSFPYVVVTTISAFVVGDTLQLNGRPIAYFSRKTKPNRDELFKHDREFLALFFS